MSADKKSKYFPGLGRRKSASATVRLYNEKQDFEFIVNDKPLDKYFDLHSEQEIAREPLKLLPETTKYAISVHVQGGGKSAQAEAIQLGLSRAIIGLDQDMRTVLRKSNYLTRDAREKERKKYGLKRARRAPQWSKR
jgi:small subunit ribosomal protein S9